MDADERADDRGARLRADLAAALKDAIRARDTVAVSALRITLSAISNAEAVAGTQATAAAGSPHFAGAVAGLGAAEVARLLTEASVLTSVIAAADLDR